MDSARRERHPALAREDAGQVGALDVRHRDVLDAVDLAEVVDADDVPVRDLPGEQQFPLEPLLDLLGGRRIRHRLRADDLDRDRDFQLLVPAWYTDPMPPAPSRRMM